MSKIKEFFSSRYGDSGSIMEADYSQLEVIILAALSKDPVLIDDVRTKDMHCISLSLLLGESYDSVKKKYDAGDSHYKKMRKTAKSLSFALQYGAGISALAANTKLSTEVCKEFVGAYYARYRVLDSYQKELASIVYSNAIPYENMGELGQKYIGHYYSPIGRAYSFVQKEAPKFLKERGENFSFSPTEIKNYMTQGTATGDLVLIGIGDLYRELYVGEGKQYNRENIFLINTIHDSVMLDVMNEDIDKVGKMVYSSLTGVRKRVKELFDWDIPLPLNVEVSVGSTWAQTKPYII